MNRQNNSGEWDSLMDLLEIEEMDPYEYPFPAIRSPPHNVADSNLIRSPSGDVVGDYVLHTLISPRNVANNDLLPIRSPSGNLVYDYALPEVDDYVLPALRSPPRNVADNVSLPSTVKRTSSRKSRSRSPSNNPRRIAPPHSPRRSSSPHNPRRSPSPNNPRRIAPPNSRRARNNRPRRSTSPNITMALPDQPLDLSVHRPHNEEVYRPVEPQYSPTSDSESEDLPNLNSPEPEERPPSTQRRPVPSFVAPKCKWHPKRPTPFPKREPLPSPHNPPVPPNSPVPRNLPVPPNSSQPPPVPRNSAQPPPVPRNSAQPPPVPENTPLRVSEPMVLRTNFPSINIIKTYYDSNFVQHIPQPDYNMGFPRYITFRLGNRKVLYSASHQYSLNI
ncbi:hypothetical protein TNIN_3631 [Trichonephila inaurata madagascariensis]|uniref:Uncharacterized protein n=1 Tax=Trichonephila inaurata madagascariensis TaxID=2747483 RepID=A0A8X7BPQ6_9ARAC|nr:hypothetical protein TNIN_3631 [Trichonephila inaurata madagascariensis]